MSKRVVAIGECMVELSAAPGGFLRKGFAGDTFNTAWYLRRQLPADWTVAYLTALGEDPVSDELLRFMEEAGLATDAVRRVPGRMPGLYMIHLDGAERSFSYWRDTSAAKLLAAEPAHLDRAVARADALYFSGITLAILSPPDRARLLARLAQAKAEGRTVAFDPNIRPRLWPDKEEMRAAIAAGAQASTIALPSFPDEAAAFGDTSVEVTAERYLSYGVAEAVVKDGPAPALLATPAGRSWTEASQGVEAVDTTGAGDSFSAAYLAARLLGEEPPEAVRRGHALAGEVVRHHGALIREAVQSG